MINEILPSGTKFTLASVQPIFGEDENGQFTINITGYLYTVHAQGTGQQINVTINGDLLTDPHTTGRVVEFDNLEVAIIGHDGHSPLDARASGMSASDPQKGTSCTNSK